MRAASIPLALWICAGAVAHLIGGGGAVEVAKVAIDRAELRALVRSVRDGMVRPDTTFEVLTENTEPTPGEKVAAPEKDAKQDPTAAKDDDPSAPADAPKPTPPKKEDAPKPTPPKAAEAPKPAPEPELPAVPAVPAKPAAPPPPPADHRIAIKQNVEKDQKDNPNAQRIADDANHTDEETVAKIRSHDQDDPNPSPGTHSGPKGEIGNSDHDKVADSEEKKGNEKHAPGEAKPSSTRADHQNPAPPAPPSPAVAKGPPPSVPNGAGKGARSGPPAAPAAPPPTPGGAGPASPEVVSADKGAYSLDPANPGGDGKSKSPGKKRASAPYQAPVRVGSLGLGGAGLPGGPNLNLNMAGVEQAVGHEKLRAEREADGAARKSAHRGSFEGNKFERWRAAIENYEPSVKLGNQTSLNAARVPFATYINGIHNRLHPIFAEEFLASLDNLSKTHALNDMHMAAHIEIVLNKDNGRIVRLGVTKSSGVTAFDIVALNSVHRAQPFGKAPEAIVSPDGNVYLHWEFHRDPYDACTTRNARPFLLKEAPKLAQPAPGGVKKPLAPKPNDDRPIPGPLVPLRDR